MLDKIKTKFQTREAIDLQKNFYDSEYNPLNFLDDLFIPVTGSVGDINIQTLGGDVNIRDIADIEFQNNKLFAGLRIPKAFLGFEESLPGSLGSTTLTRLDIRYARMVKKVKRAMIQGLTRMVQIHLAYKTKKQVDLNQIILASTPISGAEEDDQASVFERKLNLTNQILGIINDLGDKINPEQLIRHIFTKVLELPGISVKKLLTPKEEPEEPEEPPEGGEEEPPEDGEEPGEEQSFLSNVDDLKSKIKEGGLSSAVVIKILEKAAEKIDNQSRVHVERGRDAKAPLPIKEGEGKDVKKPNIVESLDDNGKKKEDAP